MSKFRFLFLLFIVIYLFGCQKNCSNNLILLKNTKEDKLIDPIHDTIYKVNQTFAIGDSVSAYLIIDTTFGRPFACTNRWANNDEYFTDNKNMLLKINFVIIDKKLIYIKNHIRVLDDVVFSGSIVSSSVEGVYFGKDLITKNLQFELRASSYGRCFNLFTLK